MQRLLTSSQVRNLHIHRREGHSLRDIANLFCVSKQVIVAALSGRNYVSELSAYLTEHGESGQAITTLARVDEWRKRQAEKAKQAERTRRLQAQLRSTPGLIYSRPLSARAIIGGVRIHVGVNKKGITVSPRYNQRLQPIRYYYDGEVSLKSFVLSVAREITAPEVDRLRTILSPSLSAAAKSEAARRRKLSDALKPRLHVSPRRHPPVARTMTPVELTWCTEPKTGFGVDCCKTGAAV